MKYIAEKHDMIVKADTWPELTELIDRNSPAGYTTSWKITRRGDHPIIDWLKAEGPELLLGTAALAILTFALFIFICLIG